MKRLDLPAIVFGLFMLAVSFAIPPVLAQPGDTLDRDMGRLQTHMERMRADLATIKAESDPAKRERLLQDHMQGLHKAMTLMQQDMMPAMKRRMHTHSHAPGAGARDADRGEWQSEAHMEKMEGIMMQMEELMGQMSEHRAMLESRE
jgi:hypothetical protein